MELGAVLLILAVGMTLAVLVSAATPLYRGGETGAEPPPPLDVEAGR